MIISLIFAFAIILGLINAPDWQHVLRIGTSRHPTFRLMLFATVSPTRMLIFVFLVAIIPAFLW